MASRVYTPPAVGDCLSFSERCFYGQWINELSAILNLLISSYCPELMILLSVELDCRCPWGQALCRLHNPWFLDLTPKRSGRLPVKKLESDAYLMPQVHDSTVFGEGIMCLFAACFTAFSICSVDVRWNIACSILVVWKADHGRSWVQFPGNSKTDNILAT